jgi:hypothetical protein
MEPLNERAAAISLLLKVIDVLDTNKLKTAVNTLVKTYAPELLVSERASEKALEKAIEKAPLKVPLKALVITYDNFEDEWINDRVKELEDGDSICCSEECSDRSCAMSVLVDAYRRGTEKRRERRGYISDSDKTE